MATGALPSSLCRLLLLQLAASLSAAPATALEMSRSQCPMQILTVRGTDPDSASEGLELSEKGLQYLEALPSPVYMVPVLGVYRGGKSMIMNRLMGLTAPYAGGFGVGHGQHTFTRGIYACAEQVQGLGTVVWMDTEGLFSHQDARAAYGPKIFTLALLFSSSVLLNNVKVLNEQFFGFFSKQQQIARMLKKGLMEAGLPEDQMLPRDLQITWVVQQPVQYSGQGGSAGERSWAQLKSFLQVRGDEARNRVQHDYQHDIFEVPVAALDARSFQQLDQMPDDGLNPEYTAAVQRLREVILQHLHTTRPLPSAGLGEQLRMFVQAVRTEEFSGTLAWEAFEATELGSLCGNYSQAIATRTGELPTRSLAGALESAREEVEQQRLAAVEEFHLNEAWSVRLGSCLDSEAERLRRKNQELVLARWEVAAGGLAEHGECFFLREVSQLDQEYAEVYGEEWSGEVSAKAHEYAAALQSTRLAECVRLWDLAWPIAPWLVWPILSLYIRDRMSGIISLLLHSVAVAGLYAVLQSFGHLPSYLDSDYPVMRSWPRLLEWVLFLPSVPWASMARTLGILGAMHSAIRLLVALPRLCRPVGDTVGQLVNLELKINVLLQRTNEIARQQQQASARSDLALRQQLVSAAVGFAGQSACGGAACAGSVELLKALCIAHELCMDGGPLHGAVAKGLARRATVAVSKFDVPAVARSLPRQLRGHDVVGCALRGEWQKLVEHLVVIAEGAIASAEEGSQESEDDLSSRHARHKKKEEGQEEVSTRDDSDDKAPSEAEEQRGLAGDSPGLRQRLSGRADSQDYERQ